MKLIHGDKYADEVALPSVGQRLGRIVISGVLAMGMMVPMGVLATVGSGAVGVERAYAQYDAKEYGSSIKMDIEVGDNAIDYSIVIDGFEYPGEPCAPNSVKPVKVIDGFGNAIGSSIWDSGFAVFSGCYIWCERDMETGVVTVFMSDGDDPTILASGVDDDESVAFWMSVINGDSTDVTDLDRLERYIDGGEHPWQVVYEDGTVVEVFQPGGIRSGSTTVTERYEGGMKVTVAIPHVDQPGTTSVGPQTGSGKTDLNMVLRSTVEKGGTSEPEKIDNPDFDETQPESDTNPKQIDNPLYNPDVNPADGLGDNLQFTVPSAINYVVKADGGLIGPSNAVIENRSVMQAHVSSMKATPTDGWNFVADASVSSDSNSVDLQIGPSADQLDVSGYVNAKAAVNDMTKWNMSADDLTAGSGTDTVALQTAGNVAHVTKDITSNTKFGELQWYVTPGEVVEKTVANYTVDAGYGLVKTGTVEFMEKPTGDIYKSIGLHSGHILGNEEDFPGWAAVIDENTSEYTQIYIGNWSILVDGDEIWSGASWDNFDDWDAIKGKTIDLSSHAVIAE